MEEEYAIELIPWALVLSDAAPNIRDFLQLFSGKRVGDFPWKEFVLNLRSLPDNYLILMKNHGHQFPTQITSMPFSCWRILLSPKPGIALPLKFDPELMADLHTADRWNYASLLIKMTCNEVRKNPNAKLAAALKADRLPKLDSIIDRCWACFSFESLADLLDVKLITLADLEGSTIEFDSNIQKANTSAKSMENLKKLLQIAPALAPKVLVPFPLFFSSLFSPNDIILGKRGAARRCSDCVPSLRREIGRQVAKTRRLARLLRQTSAYGSHPRPERNL